MRGVLSALIVLALGLSQSLAAENYPERTITVIVPVAAGGSSDIVARVLCSQLTKQIGHPCIVEDKPGGSEIMGTDFVAKAKPDGYTLLLVDPSFAIIPNWFKSTPFSIPHDFQPVSQVIAAPTVLVTRPSLNVTTLKQLIDLAHANPGKLNYGSAGVGGAPYMWTEKFKLAANVKITEIPYKGAADVVNALLGGEVDMLITTIPTAINQIKSGSLRALAVSSEKRLDALPDVPTMREAGLPGMEGNAFMGLVGPAGMPKDVVDKLYAEVHKAVESPDVQARYISQNAIPVGGTPAEFSKLINQDVHNWGDVMKQSGIQPATN